MALLGKESTEQKQENIRSYVYILRKNVFFMTGTGPWHTHALWTLLTYEELNEEYDDMSCMTRDTGT